MHEAHLTFFVLNYWYHYHYCCDFSVKFYFHIVFRKGSCAAINEEMLRDFFPLISVKYEFNSRSCRWVNQKWLCDCPRIRLWWQYTRPQCMWRNSLYIPKSSIIIIIRCQSYRPCGMNLLALNFRCICELFAILFPCFMFTQSPPIHAIPRRPRHNAAIIMLMKLPVLWSFWL